jgi:hypothetical protein
LDYEITIIGENICISVELKKVQKDLDQSNYRNNMLLTASEQKVIIVIFDIVKNSLPMGGDWSRELPKLLKEYTRKYCNADKSSYLKLRELLVYPYKFKDL